MKKVKQSIIDILFYVVGCSIYSAAVIIFTDPNQLSPGGLTGVALLLHHFFSLPTGVMTFLMNVPLIILGFISFGGRFIINTAITIGILSFTLDTLAVVVKPYYTDGILAALFGGIMMGAGLSLVFMRGATTGGTDIAAKFINRKFPFFSMGRIILIFDFLVVAASALAYKNFQSALYSIVSLYVSARVIDSLLYGADGGKLIHVVTEKPDEISNALFKAIGRGVTHISAKGGYTGDEKKLLLCAVRPPEVSAVQRAIKQCDPGAFVIISDAGEILGEGFKSNE